MFSTRYTILVADRRTGVVRRFTVGLWPGAIALAVVVSLPILVGMGAAWKAKADVADLFASQATLELELSNYRGATEALTGQIQGLQTALDDLGGRAALDPALQSAMDKLPAIVKARAMGGGGGEAAAAAMLPGLNSPEDTFGLLRDMLQGLEIAAALGAVRRRQAQRARRRDAVDLAGHGLAHLVDGLAPRPVHRRPRLPPRSRHLGRSRRAGATPPPTAR